MPERRFPPPWSVAEQPACFVVKDSAGQKLAHIYYYYEDKPGRRAATKLLTRDGAKDRGEHCQAAETVEKREWGAVSESSTSPVRVRIRAGQHQRRFYAVPRYSPGNAYGYVRPIGR